MVSDHKVTFSSAIEPTKQSTLCIINEDETLKAEQHMPQVLILQLSNGKCKMLTFHINLLLFLIKWLYLYLYYQHGDVVGAIILFLSATNGSE